MKKVEIREWSHTCGDGCCHTYGTELYVDGNLVTDNDVSNPSRLAEELLKHFGIEAEVTHTYDDTDSYIDSEYDND